MILGVNGIRLLGKRSGVGRAVEAILHCLAEIEHPFEQVRVYTPQALAPDITLPPCAKNIVLPSPLPNSLWEQIVLPAAHGSAGILLCPSYVVPLAANCPTMLIHHGSYEGYPESFSWWQLNKARAIYSASAWRASVISTVSQISKRDMVRFYGVSANRVNVIPEGVDTRKFRPLDSSEALTVFRIRTFGLDVPFIVYVGKPTKRRNLVALIRAFAAVKQRGKYPHKLLIAGASLPGNSSFRHTIQEERVSEEVVVADYLTHEELVVAYNAAEFLAYPSSYEGFGMPALEAMACGTPVLALQKTVPAEVTDGLSIVVPDASVESIARGLELAIADERLRARAREQGPRRAAEYDWRLITGKYLELMIPLVTPGQNNSLSASKDCQPH